MEAMPSVFGGQSPTFQLGQNVIDDALQPVRDVGGYAEGERR